MEFLVGCFAGAIAMFVYKKNKVKAVVGSCPENCACCQSGSCCECCSCKKTS